MNEFNTNISSLLKVNNTWKNKVSEEILATMADVERHIKLQENVHPIFHKT